MTVGREISPECSTDERREWQKGAAALAIYRCPHDLWPKLQWHMAQRCDYLHKIAQGAKTTDLPIEQPTKLEFIINLKTAQGDRPCYSADADRPRRQRWSNEGHRSLRRMSRLMAPLAPRKMSDLRLQRGLRIDETSVAARIDETSV